MKSNCFQGRVTALYNCDQTITATFEPQNFEPPSVFFEKTGIPFCLECGCAYFPERFGKGDPCLTVADRDAAIERGDLVFDMKRKRLGYHFFIEGGEPYLCSKEFDGSETSFNHLAAPAQDFAENERVGFIIVGIQDWQRNFPNVPFTRENVFRILQHDVVSPVQTELCGDTAAMICRVVDDKGQVLFEDRSFNMQTDLMKLCERFRLYYAIDDAGKLGAARVVPDDAETHKPWLVTMTKCIPLGEPEPVIN